MEEETRRPKDQRTESQKHRRTQGGRGGHRRRSLEFMIDPSKKVTPYRYLCGRRGRREMEGKGGKRRVIVAGCVIVGGVIVGGGGWVGGGCALCSCYCDHGWGYVCSCLTYVVMK
jgi:hypothetical protein